MSSLAIDNIGLLVTCDPALGSGSLGLLRDAALVFDDGRVAVVERAGSLAAAAADERLDAAAVAVVIPGFVDSHTHLVFAGDRVRGVRGPDGRRAVCRRWHPGLGAGDPGRFGGRLRGLAVARRREALRAGITHLEIKSGYALDVAGEARLCSVAAELTDDVTFLGCPPRTR